jgi:hypothetical protein
MGRTLLVPFVTVAGIVAAGCVTPPPPDPEPETLAVAYSNLDGVDGYDPGGADVLISKLVDSNADGVVSAGDRAVMNDYPLDYGAASFGSFSVTSHEVNSGLTSPTYVQVEVDAGRLRWFNSVGLVPDYMSEQYDEYDTSLSTRLDIRDSIGFPGDRISVNTDAPSLPLTGMNLGIPTNEVDNAFIDVDLFL